MENEAIRRLKETLPPFSELSELKKKTAHESAGPCPVCGGDDRFYVHDGKGFCRQCNTKGGDIVDWHCLKEGLDVAGLLKKYGISGNGKAKPTSNTRPEIVKTYDYTDASGNLVFQVCRMEPKSFRQRRPDGKGWAWNLKGVEPVLYRLPQVLKAQEVVIVEGEKDADALAALGFAATTVPGGAGKWREHYNQYLKGKRVVIIPDNDEPGRKHAAQVAQSLEGIAESIKILSLPELPESGDVSDFLATFEDPTEATERLALMIEGAEPYGPNESEPEAPRFKFIHNADILANLKPIEWRIQDVLVENSFYYDFGDSGSYKTFVAIDRLMCIAAGIDYHDHRVKQGTVFYIAGEGQQGLGRRLAAWHIEHKTKAADVPFFVAEVPTQLMDPEAVNDVRRAVDYLAREYGQPAVVHMDTLARNFGDGDENATKDMNRVISNIDTAFGNTICRGLTHHTGHTNKDRARGSYALYGASDGVFRISMTPTGQVLVECPKTKDASKAKAMLFNVNTTLLLINDQPDQSCTLSLIAEGDEAMDAKAGMVDNSKVSGNMRKALDLLDEMYTDYEKNLIAGCRKNAMPSVAVSDWRDACISKNLYKRPDSFNRALDRMLERQLLFLDEGRAHAYTVSSCLKYNKNLPNGGETV